MKPRKKLQSAMLPSLEPSRGSLPLRLGDPKQTSGGTSPSLFARHAREVSDQLPLGIRAPRVPWPPHNIPQLVAQLLLDPVPPPAETPTGEEDELNKLSEECIAAMEEATAGKPEAEAERDGSPGISRDLSHSPTSAVISPSAMPPSSSSLASLKEGHEDPAVISYKRVILLYHTLCHALYRPDLRWRFAQDIDGCAGATTPHDWAIMLPVSRRVQPTVYTALAISRYCDSCAWSQSTGSQS